MKIRAKIRLARAAATAPIPKPDCLNFRQFSCPDNKFCKRTVIFAELTHKTQHQLIELSKLFALMGQFAVAGRIRMSHTSETRIKNNKIATAS
jgi:hypothetical protein